MSDLDEIIGKTDKPAYWRPIFHVAEGCTCDKEAMETACATAVRRVAPFMVDAEGKKLFYVDSFGMRGSLPGECKPCNDLYNAGYLKATAGNYE